MKVLLIAPYSGMAEVSKQLDLPPDVKMDVTVANLEEGADFARQTMLEEYDIIISRGGTALAIEQVASLPVIHIQISGYDMLRVFTLIKNIGKKVALVGFASVTQGAATLCNILEYDIEVKTIANRTEVKALLESLKEAGYESIIGDVVTVQAAESMGLHGVLITSGKEALIQAIEEGRRAFQLSKKVRHNYDIFHQLFHEFPYPTAVIGKDLLIHERNAAYRAYLDDNALTQSTIKLPLEDVLSTGKNQWLKLEHGNQFLVVQLFKLTDTKAGMMCFVRGNPSDRKPISIDIGPNASPIIGESLYSRDLARQLTRLGSMPLSIIGDKGTGKSTVAENIHHQRFGHAAPLISIDAALLDDHALSELKQILLPIQAGSIMVLNQDKSQHVEEFTSLLTSYSHRVQIIFIQENAGQDVTIETQSIHLAPLSRRKEDIPVFAHYFLTALHAQNGSETVGIKPEAMTLLKEYDWPGNLHELKQAIHELAQKADGYYIEKAQTEMLLSCKRASIPSTSVDGTLRQIEKRIIETVLAEENGNQSRASKRLGINRSTLWRKLNEEN
ncbi:PrpR N-terminal domain-containing protein [Rossellomorea marisflavi]|uniref:PrpR N-terminal domain-containing protein n=1 Tax=Rossellomorea marisflavi TaxID=189381 RepID=UPI0028531B8A|nr:PrpR N-terminal domain-containing protein [Rossellomorea marisflavi]MDR4934945.1 PrpR N-terminal domain-containing protein [Rossellomorea marisflavi]